MHKNLDWNMNKSKKSHPLYNLIYSATDNYLTTEDEVLNKQICSEILKTPDAPKIACKIINKIIINSLVTNCYQSIWYSLLLLDMAVKNTDSRFCAAILSKEFLNDLIKIVDPKYSVPDFVQEKLIYIWKDWVSTLSSVNGHQNLLKYYKNIEYPQTSLTSSVSNDRNLRPHSKKPYTIDSTQPTGPDLNEMVKNKIIHDIDIMENNLTIFSDTIRTVSPENVTTEEVKFLEDLHETLLRMQVRINEILPSIVSEDIINQLIQVNDRILFTSAKYKRFLVNKSQVTLSPSSKSKIKSELDTDDNYYCIPNVVPKFDDVLPEIYAENSLPSYLEATVAIEEKNKKSEKELNLISFDDEDSCSDKMNYPSVPMNDPNIYSSTLGKETETTTTKSGLSSTEFDEFIERITKRQDIATGRSGEVCGYDYDDRISRPSKS